MSYLIICFSVGRYLGFLTKNSQFTTFDATCMRRIEFNEFIANPRSAFTESGRQSERFKKKRKEMLLGRIGDRISQKWPLGEHFESRSKYIVGGWVIVLILVSKCR